MRPVVRDETDAFAYDGQGLERRRRGKAKVEGVDDREKEIHRY